MKKFNIMILIAIGVVTITPINQLLSTGENVAEVNHVSESVSEDIIENEDNSEEVINVVLNDWKTYRDKVYTPRVRDFNVDKNSTDIDDIIENKSYKEITDAYINNNKTHPLFTPILSKLNPNKTVNTVYKTELKLSYGITQINMKLIPLAELYYSNFEDNPSDQLAFLNYYIEVKTNKGYSPQDIINHYKYANY